MLKIQTIARLGQDAISNNVNGKNVINFSVAHSEKFKNQQGVEVDKTTWISCAYWTERLNLLPRLVMQCNMYLILGQVNHLVEIKDRSFLQKMQLKNFSRKEVHLVMC